MSSARAGAAAVLLSDGRVLIAGGSDSNGPVNSVDVFGTDGQVSNAQAMNSPRSSYAAALLQDGRVLVTGGVTSGGGITNSAEIYDPSADTWTLLSSVMVDARSGHTASLLSDGRVLLAGGQNASGAVSSVEIFDPTNGNFSSAGVMSSPRMNHGASVLTDGRVFIVAGSDGTNPLNTSDIYDPSSGSVSAGPNLSVPRTAASATTTLDGKVVVIGGNNGSNDLASAEIFDPATGQFTLSASSLSTARSGHQSFLLPKNNSILVVGGSSSGNDLNSAELYYSWADTFQPTGAMSVARPGFGGSALSVDGHFLAAGGTGLSSTELYGFATVKTDAADYPPGTQVNISGGGWQPGETVTLTLVEVPFYDSHGPFTTVADSNGNISNGSFVTDQHDANIRFYLTAVGSNSGVQAQNTFTDNPQKPTTTIAFPSNNGSYNSSGWTSGAPIQGGVTFDSGTTSRVVKVSIKRNGTNRYWDGSAFNNAGEQLFAATLNGGQTGWTFSFAASNFPADDSYTVHSQGVDSNGTETGNTTSTFSFDTTPPSAPTNLSLASSSDTGASTSDEITNITANLKFNGSAEANSTVNLYVDGSGTSAGSGATNNGGNWNNINIAGPLSEGLHSIRATATDGAGNPSSLSAALGITIDTTAPTSGLSPAAGTYTAPFSIQWNITDPTSAGVSSGVNTSICKVTVNGSQVSTNCSGTQSLSAGTRTVVVSATDIAGNALWDTRVYTVNADSTPPVVNVTFPPPVHGLLGWYNGQDTVPVVGTVTANDTTTGNSNVTAITCLLDGSPLTVSSQSGLGTPSASGSISVSGDGTRNISCTSTDSAGNTGAASGSTNTATLKIDTTAPAITGSRTPAANANGWNNTDVKASFSCSDSLSGLAAGSPPADTTVSTEGANQSVNGNCTDVAGNTANASVSSINIDKTPPTVTASALPAPNGAGWNNSDVTVSFTGTDSLSGIANCDSDKLLNTEGTNLSPMGSCTDKAGNTGSATKTGINIDKTPPALTFGTVNPAANGAGWNNSNVSISFTATDGLSGVASTNPSASPLVLTTEGTAVSGTVTVTDVAGNTATFTSPAVKIDKTPPTITGSRTPAANANGWNNTDVKVSFSCSDSLSGLAAGSPPADATVSTEGADQSVNGICTDVAGNTANASVSSISIDKTAPTVTASASPTPNGAGWNNSDVTVSFTGTDSLSMIDHCDAAKVLNTEGSDQSATGTCTDKAGNSGSATKNGINIDKTPPAITFASRTAPNANGWNNTDVVVKWNCSDALSGAVSSIVSTTVSTEGAGQSASGNCTDVAGNTASDTQTGINIDRTPPTINATRTPAPNANGWNNTDVTAGYTASDSLSGLDSPASGNFSFSSEGAGQTHTFTVTDKAGNTASATIDNVSIDKTPPTATASASPAPNSYGWNNTNVTVSFTGSDSLSGIDTCAAPATLNSEGAAQSASGNCTDKAGNVSSTATASGINIDKTPPTLTYGSQSPAANGAGWNNTNVSFSFTTADILSGVASTSSSSPITLTAEGSAVTGSVTVTDKAGNSAIFTTPSVKIDKTPPTVSCGENPFTFVLNQPSSAVTGTVTDPLSGPLSSPISTPVSDNNAGINFTGTITGYDVAGNSASASCQYNVTYAQVKTFLQPWAPPGAVAFKIKSTVPLLWQYTDFNGNVVNSSNAKPAVFDAGSCGTGDTGDATLDYSGNSGYQYDPTSNTWQFNWKTTGSSPGCHAIEVSSGLTGQTDGPFPTQLR